MNFVWQIQVQKLRDDQTFVSVLVLMDEVSDVNLIIISLNPTSGQFHCIDDLIQE
jgi:hypothetical protein